MYFSPEQMSTIEAALKLARDVYMKAFEQSKEPVDAEDFQRAMRAARDAKRVSQVLAYIEEQLYIAS